MGAPYISDIRHLRVNRVAIYIWEKDFKVTSSIKEANYRHVRNNAMHGHSSK